MPVPVDIKEDMIYVSLTLNERLTVATGNGNIKIVMELINMGATNINYAMMYAAEGGHMEIVGLMIELCATRYGQVIKDSKDPLIVSLLKEWSSK